jgi:hypothetical protein
MALISLGVVMVSVMKVTIGAIMFMPIFAMQINPVIKRIIIVTAYFYQDTISSIFSIVFVIIAYVTHVFTGSPCYLKGQTDISPVASTLSVIVI